MTYDFECEKCGAFFLVSNINKDEAKRIQCVECKGKSLKVVGFDDSDNEGVYLVAKEFAEFKMKTEKRLLALESVLDDNDIEDLLL